MDSNVVIAAVGITSVIVGIAGTYFVQKTTLERQRKWALEDDSRRIKRERLSKRLDIVEEATKIMVNQVIRTIDREMGAPMYNDDLQLQEQGKRLQSIMAEASAALSALDSQDLIRHWRVVTFAYGVEGDTDRVDLKLGGEVQRAYAEMVKLMDTMSSQV